jgi:TPR repeat protein
MVALVALAGTGCLGSQIQSVTRDMCDADTKTGVSCGNLGDNYMRANWTSMSRQWGQGINRDAARVAYLKACDLGWGMSCAHLLEFRLIVDPAAITAIEGKLGRTAVRSDDEIEAALGKEEKQAADFDAPSASDAASILGATSQVLGQQAHAQVDPKAAKALEDAAKLSAAGADIAKHEAEVKAKETPGAFVPRTDGKHPLLDARVGAGPAPTVRDPSAVARAEIQAIVAERTKATPPPPPPPPPEPEEVAGAPDNAALDAPACKADPVCKSMRIKCKKSDAGACKMVGFGYEHAVYGLPKDLARAVALYEMACSLDGKEGCFDHAVMFLTGTGEHKNNARALQLMKRACEVGHVAAACASALNFGGLAWAMPVLRTLCNGTDAQGCLNLAFRPAEKKLASTRLKAMCADGDKPACSYLSTLAKTDPAFR